MELECFGDSSDDDHEEAAAVASSAVERDDSCGVLSFHPNTEASLLIHVRNSVKNPPAASVASSDGLRAKLERSGDVLRAVDGFCTSRHWMMHVGPEKGDVVSRALKAAMDEKMKRSSPGLPVPFVAVELGTYCGYASVLMGRALCEARPASMDCHLLTTEINPACILIAKEMIRLSCMEDVVSVHQLSYNGHETDLVGVVRGALENKRDSQSYYRADMIDFLFIDHDKHSYKADLCNLEASGLIRRGAKVVADNVLFARINDYLSYVQQLKRNLIVETRTIPCYLEYSNVPGEDLQQYLDGIEITDYLQDP